jgi:hypothetical protein
MPVATIRRQYLQKTIARWFWQIHKKASGQMGYPIHPPRIKHLPILLLLYLPFRPPLLLYTIFRHF